eukprot:5699511-Amphidinium_carterae.1
MSPSFCGISMSIFLHRAGQAYILLPTSVSHSCGAVPVPPIRKVLVSGLLGSHVLDDPTPTLKFSSNSSARCACCLPFLTLQESSTVGPVLGPILPSDRTYAPGRSSCLKLVGAHMYMPGATVAFLCRPLLQPSPH